MSEKLIQRVLLLSLLATGIFLIALISLTAYMAYITWG
jgi:hypothetical protein